MAKLKTGRHTSALKELRKSKKRQIANKSVMTKIKTVAKKVEKAVQEKNQKLAKELLNAAFSAWDKAVRENLIHKNTSSNQKSRLSKLVHSISSK